MVEIWGRVRAALALSLVTASIAVPGVAGAGIVQLNDEGSTYGISEVAAVEFAFRELINEERAGAGLDPLASFGDLVDDARLQSDDMASAGYLYHNPELAEVTASANWFKLGENVGYGPTVDILHQAFMDSAPHAANVLTDEYNYLGVGATIDGGGTIWVTMVFMHGPDGLAAASEQGPETFLIPFLDDDNSPHADAIAAIAEAGITSGCDSAGERFCPDAVVTRAQMATFLVRALDLPPTDIDHFIDDDGLGHEDAINRLAAAGITSGCGEGRYCPGVPIERAQMATFLVRALDLPASGIDHFSDDSASSHEPRINALAAAGVTGGCGGDAYCPGAIVTRAQMATFLARALGLI